VKKKPVTKGRILYDSIYMKCPEQANLWRQKDQQLPGAAEKGKWGDVQCIQSWGFAT